MSFNLLRLSYTVPSLPAVPHSAHCAHLCYLPKGLRTADPTETRDSGTIGHLQRICLLKDELQKQSPSEQVTAALVCAEDVT